MRTQDRSEISISIVGRPPPDVHRTKVLDVITQVNLKLFSERE